MDVEKKGKLDKSAPKYISRRTAEKRRLALKAAPYPFFISPSVSAARLSTEYFLLASERSVSLTQIPERITDGQLSVELKFLKYA